MYTMEIRFSRTGSSVKFLVFCHSFQYCWILFFFFFFRMMNFLEHLEYSMHDPLYVILYIYAIFTKVIHIYVLNFDWMVNYVADHSTSAYLDYREKSIFIHALSINSTTKNKKKFDYCWFLD